MDKRRVWVMGRLLAGGFAAGLAVGTLAATPNHFGQAPQARSPKGSEQALACSDQPRTAAGRASLTPDFSVHELQPLADFGAGAALFQEWSKIVG
jgi:hypothetical protein